MAKDAQDPGTIDLVDTIAEPRRRGRPRKYKDDKERWRAAQNAYRERKRQAKANQADDKVHSDIIDLSALPAWRRR